MPQTMGKYTGKPEHGLRFSFLLRDMVTVFRIENEYDFDIITEKRKGGNPYEFGNFEA